MELKEKTAIVVGASSGIGAAVARELVRDGWSVALVARRRDELEKLAAQLNQRAGAEVAFAVAHDVTDYASVPAEFDGAASRLGGLAMMVYAAGVMPQVGPEEYGFAKDRLMAEVNYLGMVAWCNEAAQFFSRLQSGVIVGIGSVAGDRGRKGQPGYNASKGAQAVFLEALRNRLHSKGVRVVTVKPGPVDTPMTRGLGNQPFMISADQAARAIVRAAAKSRSTVYVPARWGVIMHVIRHIPSFIFRRLDI
jgi:NAD(P)-dependent dehydrogenase (short-subunit alcohol dehydrogenase family)